MASPSDLSAELSPDRLSTVAQLMLEVLDHALLDTRTPYDCAYTRGTLSWGRIKNALLLLIVSKQHSWLTLRHSGNDLLIGIGPHLVRFFLDDHLNPRKPRVFNPTDGEMVQLKLAFSGSEDRTVTLWRFIVERAISDDDEHRVYFVGYNNEQDVIALWQYSEPVRAFVAVDDHVPAAAQLDPVDLSPIYNDETLSDPHEAHKPAHTPQDGKL